MKHPTSDICIIYIVLEPVIPTLSTSLSLVMVFLWKINPLNSTLTPNLLRRNSGCTCTRGGWRNVGYRVFELRWITPGMLPRQSSKGNGVGGRGCCRCNNPCPYSDSSGNRRKDITSRYYVRKSVICCTHLALVNPGATLISPVVRQRYIFSIQKDLMGPQALSSPRRK